MAESPSKNGGCIFCKIIERAIPSQKVFETDSIYAFKDISPQAPVHVLIVPKKHIASIMEVTPATAAVLQDIFFACQQIARDLNIASAGFRTVFNSGPHACQSVHHIHMHLLGGTQLGGSMVG